MVDRIRKVVEKRSSLEPIMLFLGAKTAFLGGARQSMGATFEDLRSGRTTRKDRRGEQFSKAGKRFNFESRGLSI